MAEHTGEDHGEDSGAGTGGGHGERTGGARHPDILNGVPMKAADEPPGWLDDRKTVDKVFYALCAVSAGLLLIDPLIHKHGGFAIAHWWGFYGIFGFVACVVLVLAAAWLRRIVTKPEDYYRPPQPPRDPGGLDP